MNMTAIKAAALPRKLLGAVILMVDVEEFAYKDAAEILSIPIGTIMSRLSRGRKLLREQLSEVAQSYGIGRAAGQGQES